MKTPLQILNDIQIAAPCPARWESMVGDDFVRHCPECNKNVYDLSQLTGEQAADLMRRKEGDLCIQLYRRRDGTILTADCPVGVRERTRRFLRRSVALVASVVSFGFFSGCDEKPDICRQYLGKLGALPTAPNKGRN